MKKRILSLLLCFMLVAHVMPVMAIDSATAMSVSAVWNGTADTRWYDPADNDFTLYTPEELAGLAQLVNSHVDNFAGKTIRLGGDMFLNDTSDRADWETSPPDNSWVPIGNKQGSVEMAFGGSFIGEGHAIHGLYINGAASHAGLFGIANPSAHIENVGIADSLITTDSMPNIGGIVGTNRGIIVNCWNMSVIFAGIYVGGIAGYNEGIITGCWNDGTVSGSSNVGGIAGHNSTSSKITDCYNYAAVSGNSYVGGITGLNEGDITNCFNSAPISGVYEFAGGISGDSWANIENCFNTGTVSAGYSGGGISGGCG